MLKQAAHTAAYLSTKEGRLRNANWLRGFSSTEVRAGGHCRSFLGTCRDLVSHLREVSCALTVGVLRDLC